MGDDKKKDDGSGSIEGDLDDYKGKHRKDDKK